MRTPAVEIALDTTSRDALFTLATCSALIAGCVAPSRTLDACVVSAPLCTTTRPWAERAVCCPSACRDEYESHRRLGDDPITAFRGVYFDRPRCFPGALELLQEGP